MSKDLDYFNIGQQREAEQGETERGGKQSKVEIEKPTEIFGNLEIFL